MDIRTIVIQKVTEALRDRAYEVTERCTDVAVRDSSAEGMSKKFIATKKVRERQIPRYSGMQSSIAH